jgi:hypothetical protein
VQDLIGNTQLNPALESKVNELLAQMNTGQGFIGGWLAGKRTEKINEVWANLNANQSILINNFMMLVAQIQQGKRNEIEFKMFVSRNAAAFLEIQALADRIERAKKKGITVGTYTELKEGSLRWKQGFKQKKREQQHEFTLQQQKDQHEFDMWLKKEKALLQLDISRKQGFSDIELDVKKEEAKIEWDKFKKEKDFGIQAAILANLSEVAEIGFLTQILLVTIQTIQTTKSLPDADRYIDQIEVFENNRKKLVELIDGRFQQVL